MQAWIWLPTETRFEKIYFFGFGVNRELHSEMVRFVSIRLLK